MRDAVVAPDFTLPFRGRAGEGAIPLHASCR
jgi:hypothetical protein